MKERFRLTDGTAFFVGGVNMQLHFNQDHFGIKAGEVLNIVDARHRIEYSVYFTDAALEVQLVNSGIATKMEPEPIRTAMENPKKARKAVKR